ncbi:toxin-antitoxin system YwqK family antitoxin [Ramlibacter alkalitolerans]|uniref:toxin-antitoxin system YwqK family antitoxin n=1 Tax=Ramlibacter alkalitolerans TaxID=2039631 RepID=UPI002ED19057
MNIAEFPYESGTIRYRYSRVMAPDGKRWLRHGLFVEYSEAGAVLSEGTYVDGKEHGLWRDFHPNGVLACEGKYEHGLEHGEWCFWDERGNEERRVISEKGEARA